MQVILAQPRGFCAGVVRAIEIVDRALVKHGAPVFVRHEIVHNKHVVEGLKDKGARFVEELDEVPTGAVTIFSAHGVSRAVVADASQRQLHAIDATCPLVIKVHTQGRQYAASGRTVILIGHAGHPEVVGTMGQVAEGRVLLVEDAAQAEAVAPDQPGHLAYITQTTLSVDDTARIVAVLRRRFPAIEGPRKEDICYATTNRQQAVKAIAPHCEAVMVIGAPNSSNSKRLVEVAARAGCDAALLVQRAAEIDWTALAGIRRLGVSAGASAPELLVDEVIAACRERFSVTIEEVSVTRETTAFKLPAELVSD